MSSDQPTPPDSANGAAPVQPAIDARHLRVVLESAPDAILLLGGDGSIVELNPAAERVTGHARADVIGREFAGLIAPEHERDRIGAMLRGPDVPPGTTPPDAPAAIRALRADGSEFAAELTIAPARVGDDAFFTAYLRDTSDRQRSERQLHLRVAQQAAVAELGQEILTTDDAQQLLERTVRLVAGALGNTLCQALELSPDGTSFLMRAGVGWPSGVIGHSRVGLDGQAGHTLRTGAPVILEDMSEETRFTRIPLLVEQGVVSGMSVLIPGRDAQPWGVLATHSTCRQQFTPEDVHFLQSIANTLSAAIHRRQWEQSLIESEARERARADELNAIMESVPAVIWIAHDREATQISGSRASYEVLGMPRGRNQSLTPADGEVPSHFEVYQAGRRLQAHELPVQRAARGEVIADYEEEIRFADGTRKVLFGNAKPLYDHRGKPRGSVAAFVDITARRDATEERERLHARLDADRLLMEQLLEQMPVGVVAVEAPSGKLLFQNRRAEQISGVSAADLDPFEFANFQAWSADDGRPYRPERWPLSRALHQGETVVGEEMQFATPAGTRTVSASAMPILSAHGEAMAAVVTFHDITERKRREEAAAFLAEATDLLASPLDYERTLERVAELAVPRLADWCVVDIREPDESRLRRFAAHADPDKVELAQRLAHELRFPDDAPRGVAKVMRTGEPEWVSNLTDEMLVEAAREESHLEVLRELGLRSYVCMPIKLHGAVLGALTLIMAESGPRDMEEHRQLAEELTYRVALALDNARLYRDARRELAEREQVEAELRELNERLEQRVAERTGEIEQRAAQLRALTFELTQTEQRERRRLAQVLHDHLQQLLVAGKFEIASALSTTEDDRITGMLERMRELLDQAIQESRSLSVELSPPVLYDGGLAAGLQWLGRRMDERHGLAVDVHAEGIDPIDEDRRVLLFDLVRELLFNVVKHADAARAVVTAARDADGMIEIAVADEGQGFDPALAETSASRDRFGLFSMRERIARAGGELRVDSIPGSGTRAILRVPETTDAELVAANTAATGIAHGPTGGGAGSAAAANEGAETERLQVVLADDHEIVREGLVRTVAAEPDLEVIGEASDGAAALELVRKHRPAVVLLDVTMPRVDGIEAARRITREFPDVRVIGLSMHESDDMAATMHAAGAAEYIDKAAPSGRLLEAIRKVRTPAR